MTAAKSGFIAEFVTGYLQREIRLEAKIAGGTDKGLRDKTSTGLAVGRLVKLSTDTDGAKTLTAATGSTAAAILADATHIIAQSDDSIREDQVCGDPEHYSSLPNLIVKNSTEVKTVAVYKIVDKDDIKVKDLTRSST